MNIGFSLMIGLIVVAHVFIVLGAVVNLRKIEMCICGRIFSFPQFGNYICSDCGKIHLAS